MTFLPIPPSDIQLSPTIKSLELKCKCGKPLSLIYIPPEGTFSIVAPKGIYAISAHIDSPVDSAISGESLEDVFEFFKKEGIPCPEIDEDQ